MQPFQDNHPARLRGFPLTRRQAIYLFILTTVLVFFNYQFHLETTFMKLKPWPLRFGAFIGLYVVSYCGSFLLIINKNIAQHKRFLKVLLFLVPALFAMRMSSGNIASFVSQIFDYPWGRYFGILLNPVLKFFLLLIAVYYIKKAGGYTNSLTGLQKGTGNLKPFVVALIFFVPVIFFFAKQPAFLDAYPRFRRIDFIFVHTSRPWIAVTGFELSYVFDFLFTEVFFRGLLVFAFVRYVGIAAIFPMASLYCCVHFGKPVVECVSSYFGGLLLGYISLRTNSISGALLLHLGIGLIMEFAGSYQRG